MCRSMLKSKAWKPDLRKIKKKKKGEKKKWGKEKGQKRELNYLNSFINSSITNVVFLHIWIRAVSPHNWTSHPVSSSATRFSGNKSVTSGSVWSTIKTHWKTWNPAIKTQTLRAREKGSYISWRRHFRQQLIAALSLSENYLTKLNNWPSPA